MSIKSKLSRLKKHMALPEQQSGQQSQTTDDAQVSVQDVQHATTELSMHNEGEVQHVTPELSTHNENEVQHLSGLVAPRKLIEKWSELEAQLITFEEQYAFVKEERLPLHTQHGLYTYQEAYKHLQDLKQEELAGHPLANHDIALEELRFFDTETTGLSGTGTHIFLLGYSYFEQEEVVVKQFILPGPEQEVALFHHFLADFDERYRLVSYNGKAFDWPQIKTRHTLIRDRLPKLPVFGHYDLLHAARRMWKETLPSCRLSVVEEEVLGYKREDDIPGYLAPMLYFDYIDSQDPLVLKEVLNHHAWDVRSLIILYGHLAKLITAGSGTRLELFQLGKWCYQEGLYHKAGQFFEAAHTGEGMLAKKAALMLGLVYKRQERYDLAEQVWLQAMTTEHVHDAYQALIELAKLYEHQYKQISKALECTLRAYQLYQSGKLVLNQQDQDNLLQRLNRLEQK